MPQNAFRVAAVLAALTVASTGRAQQAVTLGEAFALDSKVMAEARRVVVWTPPGYDTGRRRVPVLYVTDAQAQFAHTVTTVEFLARNGRIPPMLVVGIFNTDRTRDLTPYQDGTPDNDKRLPTAGGADRFLQFFETELIPWVEGRYRTEPYRVFAGHSFGGLFAVHALAARPGLFNATIAVSPTLAWRQGEPSKRMEQMLLRNRELKAALYLTLGEEGDEMQSGFDRMKAVLDRHAGKALRWHMVSMRDEDHGSIVLRSHYDGLEKIFDGWRLPLGGPDAFTGGMAEVDAHYARLSERLGWTITPPEATVNFLGYGALGRGKVEDALQLFRANVRNYPESPNVYDSLGEGLEAAGKLREALTQYEEAVKRGEAAADPLLDAFREHRDAARKKIDGR